MGVLPSILLELFPRSSQHITPDHHIIHVPEHNSATQGPTLDFPEGGTNVHVHSLGMSNLFVDLTHAGPNPTPMSYEPYLNAAVTDHRPMIANTLLVWYMFLSGHIDEDTFWADDKSCIAISLSFLLAHLMSTVSDLLETILSHLLTRVVISKFPRDFQHFLCFLRFSLASNGGFYFGALRGVLLWCPHSLTGVVPKVT